MKFCHKFRKKNFIYEKNLKICEKKIYERDKKRLIFKKMQSDETRNGKIHLSECDNFQINTFY